MIDDADRDRELAYQCILCFCFSVVHKNVANMWFLFIFVAIHVQFRNIYAVQSDFCCQKGVVTSVLLLRELISFAV